MGLKVLSIGSERNLFVKNSDAQKRIQEYGKLFDELHIIVFTNKNLGYENINISNNISLYPTNHKYKILYLWNIYKIARILAGHKLSVITAQDPFESGLAGWLLKLKYKLPLQIQIHTDIFSSYFWQESWINKIRVLLAKFLLPRADGIRAVSQRIKDSLNSKFQTLNSKITVLPIFIDVKKIQSAKIKTDLHKKYLYYDNIILIASRITTEKNFHLVMRVVSGVFTKYPKTLFLIVGKVQENIQELLFSPHPILQNNVIIESWTDDLVSYYKTADLFLLSSNYEGYGRTIVEAMAAGLPVVMTDVGLAGELLVDDLDGRVVPVGDVKALTEAILELIENPAKREEFKQNSLKLLENLPTKKEYLEKYENALKLLQL